MAEKLITLSDPKYEITYTSAKFDFPGYDELKKQADTINREYSQVIVTPNNIK